MRFKDENEEKQKSGGSGGWLYMNLMNPQSNKTTKWGHYFSGQGNGRPPSLSALCSMTVSGHVCCILICSLSPCPVQTNKKIFSPFFFCRFY